MFYMCVCVFYMYVCVNFVCACVCVFYMCTCKCILYVHVCGLYIFVSFWTYKHMFLCHTYHVRRISNAWIYLGNTGLPFSDKKVDK